MKVVVYERHGIKSGDLVSIHVSLKRSQEYANISIFSRECIGDFSPFIPDLNQIPQFDKPVMLKPLFSVLNKRQVKAEFNFTAHCDMDLQIINDVDLKTDVAIPDIKCHVKGKFIQKIRRIGRNIKRIFRGLYVARST
jgi:hypothetical protein